MRLASLARKIGIKPTELTEFVTNMGVELSSGSNTKLYETVVTAVYEHYAPGFLDEVEDPPETEVVTEPEPVAEPASEEISEVETPVDDLENDESEEERATRIVTEKVWSDELEPDLPPPGTEEPKVEVEEKKEEVVPRTIPAEPLDEIEEDPDIEVIRAPKVELPGLKVKGKIDLPPPPPPKEREEKEKPKRVKNDRRNKSRGRKPRDGNYNPLEAERRRQAKEEDRLRKEKAKAEKERKKKRYEEEVLAKVKTKSISTSNKKRRKPVEPKPVESVPENNLIDSESIIKPRRKKEEKVGTMKKFWRWLNT